jgi:Swt1-like HEPN
MSKEEPPNKSVDTDIRSAKAGTDRAAPYGLLSRQATLALDAVRASGGTGLLHLTEEMSRHQRAMWSAASPMIDFQRPEMRHLTEMVRQHNELTRLMVGPVEELRRAGLLDPSLAISADLASTCKIVADYDRRFQLPGIAEALRLSQMPSTRGIPENLFHGADFSHLKLAIASMQSPWMDAQNSMRSIASFIELQGIGQALRSMPAFDDRLAGVLRDGLGDWRQSIEWPASIFSDAAARSTFYDDRGFNHGLTDFPAAAFDESMLLSGLKSDAPLFADDYGLPIGERGETNEEEEGFRRTNAAHDRLQRFETRVRRFIDKMMTDKFGDDWTRHRIPEEIYNKWCDKKQKARDNGEPDRPLIAYSDFTDYTIIIVKKDNWNEIFKEIFRRQENIRESFQRLFPIRICTMHARIITQDDELYLHAETTRILRAIQEI